MAFKLDKIDLGVEFSDKGKHMPVFVDQVDFFCNPSFGGDGWSGSDEVSDNNQLLETEYRELSIPSAYISTKDHGDYKYGDFYKLNPNESQGDLHIAKPRDSAFDGTNLDEELQARGKRVLWVSGFNASACVKKTVKTACQLGYEVNVILDGLGNDVEENQKFDVRQNAKSMQSYGAKVVDACDALEYLSSL